MKLNKNESGRSVAEMLGTLAIMGILSVGGVVGFRYMMDKYKADTIIEEAKMHAALISGQALIQGIPQNIILNTLSYSFTYHKESNVGYSLKVEGVDKSVCKILQSQRQLGWAESLIINDGADCKEENTVAFYINTEMTTDITNEDRVVACEDDTDCGECGRCGQEQKLCVFNDFYCTDADKPYCNKGICQECESGKFWQNSRCYSCFGSEVLSNVDKESCKHICPNRVYASQTSVGKCFLPCAKGEFIDETGKCFSCNEPLQKYTNKDNCTPLCPNRVWGNGLCSHALGQCPKGYILQDNRDLSCFKCDSLGAPFASRIIGGNCLTDCGELRDILSFTPEWSGYTYTVCALKKCPSNAPIRVHNGSCGICGATVAYAQSEDECYKCPNSCANIEPYGTSERVVCRPCPNVPNHPYIQDERGCVHCGFKWDETDLRCVSN